LPAEPSSTRAPALETIGLTAGYGDIEIVQAIDLAVSEGSLVSVVGPNGAGKTTLLKAILGLVRVFDGRVHLDGEDVTRLPMEQLRPTRHRLRPPGR